MKKMRLIPVVYFGFTAMDRRFSSPMLPWIFSEIRKREYQEKLSLGVEDGCLQAYNQDFEVQFAHKLSMMTRFSQADSDPNTFLYLLRDDVDQLLYCYLFATYKQNDVNELYQQMKDHHQAPKATPPSNNLTTLCVDISPSCSNFFEVLYIGKIKVWHKKVPDSFIDDALDKFKQHDLEKNRKKLARLKSEMDLRRGSIDSTCSLTDTSSTIANGMGVPRLQRSHSLLSNLSIKSPDVDRQLPTCIDRITEDNDQEEAETREPSSSSLEKEKEELRKMSLEPPPPNLQADLEEELEKQLKKAANDEHNRTMVLQVDRTDLRLISPDRKVILLHKQHRDVTTCIQGSLNSQHFGFIAKEASNPGTVATYIGFVFKCESASVAAEAVAAITQAFTNPASESSTPMSSLGGATGRGGGQHRNSITSCDHCPMVWYHRLCCDIEALAERKQQAAIMRRIEQLDDDEQHLIMAKYRGAETDSLRERNEFLMMLLRAHCEMQQARHTHATGEQRSEFLNQYLGGGNTIFMKAKRSLSNSFDHLLKRRGSRDDFAAVTREITKDLTLPVHSALSRESSPNAATSTTKDTTHDTLTLPEGDKEQLKSPMMDIFMKVGSNSTPPGAPSSWRQAIFKRVITPVQRPQGHKYTRDELRHLWKKSIHQAILLVRMEKENARIRAKQEESAVKRIKLEYDEMRLKNAEPYSEIWEIATLNKDDKSLRGKPDVKILLQAIKLGIPRGKRGDVWHYLAEQYCAELPPIDLQKFPTYGTPYETLLKQLTSHQHAILIDLGRTFPGHSYYASPLGPGQLALFNLLKAYSLLDPEVGYCQGLSFVAGVLLLHMDESSAFFLLTHLMYRRNLRQQYLPDMVGLQIKLYQLSRLLRDHLPAVYDHLDRYEVAPTLYAAPWLLTIFASQFPLGFVTRVFDLIFLENADAVFRVILALLTHHASAILACDSFEDIMSLLKTKLPQIDAPTLLDTIFRRVYALDLSKQLAVYAVEYNVLQEEMQSIQAQMETFHKTAARLRHAEEQQKLLTHQLDAALENVQRGEQTRASQQQNIQRLETHNRSLEVTINTLGGYLHNLIETNPNLHIPGEVRRILGKIPEKPKEKHLFNLFNKQNPPMVKSLSTGRIATPPATTTTTTNDYNLRTHSLNINGNITSITPKKDVISPTNSTDSGVSTPTTHKDIIDESEEDSVNNNSEKKGPPLNHSDLTMTYNHRELKKVKSTRDMSRNSSPIVD